MSQSVLPRSEDLVNEQACLVEALRSQLASHREALSESSRDDLIRALDLARRLDIELQEHLNLLATQIYEQKHPKHWLWRAHKQFILDRVQPGEKVLDVGCGASAYLQWMAEKGCLVTACDINPKRIEICRRTMSHPKLKFLVSSPNGDLPDGPYDVIIMSHLIEHLDDPTIMLRRAHQYAPKLIVAVPPEDSRWQKLMYRDLGLPWKDDEDHRREYTPDLLETHLSRGGWRIVELHAGIDIKAVAVPAS